MTNLVLVRMAGGAAALAAVLGAPAFAQTAPTAAVPTPAVMTDTAPLPAQHRDSLGAIILPESPVLAQREQLAPLAQPVDTRAMGAGTARMLEKSGLKSSDGGKRGTKRSRDTDAD